MLEGIFVRYEENCIRWWIRDLKGKYHFSRDVIFNENTPGHLSSKKHITDLLFIINSSTNNHVEQIDESVEPNQPTRKVQHTLKGTA